MTRASLTTTTSVCVLALVACAAEVPMAVDVCRFGEVVGSWRTWDADRREMIFVIDTHGEGPSRAEVASAAGTVARIAVTGDIEGDGIPESSLLDDDLRILVISSALGCGEPPASIEWVPVLGIGGDAETFVMRVEKAVTELPACSSSTPLAATTRFLASQELDDVGPVSIDLVIITDEDEPEADPESLLAQRLPDAYRLEDLSVVSPIPVELESTAPDWDAVLASSVCVAGAESTPALLSAARAIESTGVRVAVGSLCGELWTAPVHVITSKLPGPAPWWVAGSGVTPAGELADCELLERLDPAGFHARCADLPGRDPIPIAIDEEGFETCRMIQRGPDDVEPGWRLDRTHDFCCLEDQVEVDLVGIEAEPASLIELRCGSIPATEQCK